MGKYAKKAEIPVLMLHKLKFTLENINKDKKGPFVMIWSVDQEDIIFLNVHTANNLWDTKLKLLSCKRLLSAVEDFSNSPLSLKARAPVLDYLIQRAGALEKTLMLERI